MRQWAAQLGLPAVRGIWSTAGAFIEYNHGMEDTIDRTEGYFTGWAGLELFRVDDQPGNGAAASLVIVHGYAEHSGRHEETAAFFAETGLAVHRFDMRGYGRSEGMRADAVRIIDYVKDLKTFVDSVRASAPRIPLFILAHSLGACVAALFAATHSDAADGLITSSIYLRDAAEYSRAKIAAAYVLRFFVPLLPVQEFDASRIAEDPEVAAVYRSDPLIYHGLVRVRMGLHFVEMERKLTPHLSEIHIPLLVLNGGKDRVAALESSTILHEAAGSQDKVLRTYTASGHDLLHDRERNQVREDIRKWIIDRLSQHGRT